VNLTASDALYDRLHALCVTPGPSGREELVRELLIERWGPRLTSLEVDAVGNVVGRLGAAGPRLALVAHMDEIGWTVRHITADGFLLVDTAQGSRAEGPPIRHMIGHEVVVLGRSGVVASGVFAAASGHLLTRERVEQQSLGWSDFFVDLGVSTQVEAEAAGVYVGSPVVFGAAPGRLGSRIVGKAMDDRVALCILDLLLERLDPAMLRCSVLFVATVHEEGGLHGAHAVSLAGHADLAVVLDVGLVGDIPTVEATEYAARLGAGPTLVHKDGQIAYDHRLTWAIADVATAAGIAYQHGVFSQFSSDGIPLMRAGVPTALIGVPTRYTHTAFELVDPVDVLATTQLLEALVTSDELGKLARRTSLRSRAGDPQAADELTKG